MTDPAVRLVEPLAAAPDAEVTIPGSKSVTNRALLCAALADGTSTLAGALFADDTAAMVGVLRGLGVEVRTDEAAARMVVAGAGRGVGAEPATVDARKSGATSRFVLPAAALTAAPVVVDGAAQLRARPFGPLLDAMVELGAAVRPLAAPGYLPVEVAGPIRGGEVTIPGHLSSQFLSGLMLAAPLLPGGLRVRVSTPLVSVPYVRMTARVMAAFGATGADVTESCVVVPAGSYRGVAYRVEPDASAASYFFAAAAITGGRITVPGLGPDALQGDVAFVDVLAKMGAAVERGRDAITVRGTGTLHGIDVDMADISDTAQTLAAVAVHADSPTRVRGIGFIRRKETDRIGAVVTELRRAGIDATEDEDGFTIHPGTPRPTTFATYDDHRMAMSLALLGLGTPGIGIADPGCVAKTFPTYFEVLDSLR
ncbi:3-phosphoshikimate 1-carboxyvinyltransferase [Actinocatenispora thailandica]|uniref:3-phosphoshikimate 1-carboxyvinyltransferase n=1 Tax=Actinocatenispora thailandica TaxID=227318 RepID=A0A7R7HZM5_9ACTN|nr:3-phosphoshikimate 1-carboxyvinyltransferase [Actinocatenispora thailandica]BCJ38418.1 3-phosphoshikimate 1-carboxyvinyltransferase [Actinocatenispora thailandica]